MHDPGPHDMNDATRLLPGIQQGGPGPSESFLPLVYEELRLLAAQRLSTERVGQALQPTALVHEAYLRLTDVERTPVWASRGHFFGAAAEAMRRILIDRARKRRRPKHGGDRRRIQLDPALPAGDAAPDALLGIDEAMERLGRRFPEKARLVKLRYSGGCSLKQAADVMGISPATAKRHWAFARSYLRRELVEVP